MTRIHSSNARDIPFKRITSVALYVVLIGLPAVFGFMDKPAQMGLTIAAAFVGLAFLNLDRIRRFKAGSLEAEMRDAVEQAYATIEEMKTLTRTLVLVLIDFLLATGRPGLLTPHEKIAHKRELDRLAADLGFEDDPRIQEAEERFFLRFAWDHVGFLGHILRGQGIGSQFHDMAHNESATLTTPEELIELTKDIRGEHANMIVEAIEDYRYFLEHRELRRPQTLNYRTVTGRDH